MTPRELEFLLYAVALSGATAFLVLAIYFW